MVAVDVGNGESVEERWTTAGRQRDPFWIEDAVEAAVEEAAVEEAEQVWSETTSGCCVRCGYRRTKAKETE